MGGGKSQTSTSTNISSPYVGLPDWAAQYYRDDMALGQMGTVGASDIRDFLAENPRAIEGISGEEYSALNRLVSSADDVSGQLAGGQDRLRAAEDAYGGDLRDVIGGIDPMMDRYSSQLEDARGMIGGDQFRSAYTDNVVDATLDGIQRQADREQMERGASEASIGGITSTRSAVADMLGDESLARTMYEAESGLRDSAERFATEAGFTGAGVLGGLAGQEYQGGLAGAEALRALYGDDFRAQASGVESDRMSLADIFGTQSAASGAEGAMGALARDQRQQQSDAIRNAGREAQSWWTDVFSSTRQTPATGSTSSSGTSTQPGPSTGSQILGAASTAAGIWSKLSDERTKEDVSLSDGGLEKIRQLPSYEYRYKDAFADAGGTAGRTSGLMAQDIERAGIVGAVSEVDGVKVVDPYPVLATVVQAVRELDAKIDGRNRMRGAA